jgi:DNA repair protein RadA/Sms
VILLGGDPGIGKSTLLLQAMAAIGGARKALYVTGEESVEQVALRADRLGLLNAPVAMLAEVQLEAIVATITAETPEVVVIDSIQTAYTEALTSAPGSVAQVRECAAQLTRLAKERHIVVIFVGHVTKEGSIAGPRVLEHIVDTVLYFEGDTHSSFRLVRAIKNRFGAANELGVFAMTERGLRGVANPSALFLTQHGDNVPGSAVVATLEGSRPLLVEIQALVDPVQGAMPKRLSVGLDAQRLSLLLAVLHRHGGVETAGYDVFVNAVGRRAHQRAGSGSRHIAGRALVVDRPPAAGQDAGIRRGGPGGGDSTGAARAGADSRSREARVSTGVDTQPEQAATAH